MASAHAWGAWGRGFKSRLSDQEDMKDNKLTVCIHKPVDEVFTFTVTPPNSTLWIDSIVDEKTNEWPVQKGTRYILRNGKGDSFKVIVTAIEKNKMVEWISHDRNYHCRYRYRPFDNTSTEFLYFEWVDNGNIKDPFTMETLEKLKSVLEGR